MTMEPDYDMPPTPYPDVPDNNPEPDDEDDGGPRLCNCGNRVGTCYACRRDDNQEHDGFDPDC